MTKARLIAAALMTVTAGGVGLVSHWEGRRLTAYLDVAGIPTICDGITAGVRLGQVATPAECDAKLKHELNIVGNTLRSTIKVPITQSMFDSFSSFTYNVGTAAWTNSTLLRKLNSRDYYGACAEMLRWDKAKINGPKSPPVTVRGLTNRRWDEYKYCMKDI